jgi:hypothetical protein
MGPGDADRERRGQRTEIGDHNRAVQERNARRQEQQEQREHARERAQATAAHDKKHGGAGPEQPEEIDRRYSRSRVIASFKALAASSKGWSRSRAARWTETPPTSRVTNWSGSVAESRQSSGATDRASPRSLVARGAHSTADSQPIINATGAARNRDSEKRLTGPG